MHLKQVPELQKLCLGMLPIMDLWLYHLRQIPDLEVLVVSGTKIIDQGLAHTRGLEQPKEFVSRDQIIEATYETIELAKIPDGAR